MSSMVSNLLSMVYLNRIFFCIVSTFLANSSGLKFFDCLFTSASTVVARRSLWAATRAVSSVSKVLKWVISTQPASVISSASRECCTLLRYNPNRLYLTTLLSSTAPMATVAKRRKRPSRATMPRPSPTKSSPSKMICCISWIIRGNTASPSVQLLHRMMNRIC